MSDVELAYSDFLAQQQVLGIAHGVVVLGRIQKRVFVPDDVESVAAEIDELKETEE